MIKFNSFEEINAAHPINGESNLKFLVKRECCFVLSDADKKWAKENYPFGWEDKTEHKWHFYSISQTIWYDSYIYNGVNWILGIDTWDGIIFAEEPKWGIQYSDYIPHREFGLFKTLEEAEEYQKRKFKERLEF